jgi:hypothetical protein
VARISGKDLVRIFGTRRSAFLSTWAREKPFTTVLPEGQSGEDMLFERLNAELGDIEQKLSGVLEFAERHSNVTSIETKRSAGDLRARDLQNFVARGSIARLGAMVRDLEKHIGNDDIQQQPRKSS